MYNIDIEELESLDIDNLKVIKKGLKYDIQSMEDGEEKENKKEYLSAIEDVLSNKLDTLHEDASASSGGGVAFASAASVAGMGDVSSAQPSSSAGSSIGGDEGSGDYGVPLYTYSKAGGITGNKTHKGGRIGYKGKKLTNMLSDFIKKFKKNGKYNGPGRDKDGKLMSYQDFTKDSIDKVTKIKENVDNELILVEDMDARLQDNNDWQIFVNGEFDKLSVDNWFDYLHNGGDAENVINYGEKLIIKDSGESMNEEFDIDGYKTHIAKFLKWLDYKGFKYTDIGLGDKFIEVSTNNELSVEEKAHAIAIFLENNGTREYIKVFEYLEHLFMDD